MKTFSIREIRGADLLREVGNGDLLGLLSNRSMIAVLIPVTSDLIGKVIETAWPSRRDDLREGEAQLLNASPELVPDSASRADEGLPTSVFTESVRIGDLSAQVIEQAGKESRIFGLTHDRELIGMVVPVTENLVRELVEENLPIILDSVSAGEKGLRSKVRMS